MASFISIRAWFPPLSRALITHVSVNSRTNFSTLTLAASEVYIANIDKNPKVINGIYNGNRTCILGSRARFRRRTESDLRDNLDPTR